MRLSDYEEFVLWALGSEVEVRALPFRERYIGTVEESECSDFGICDFVSILVQVVGMNYPVKLDNGVMCSETENIKERSLGVVPGGCDDVMVENEGSYIEATMGSCALSSNS
ncbi:unnamed protein product [Arabidopsis lyrata]|nr:unnamed protein product [Arabidopsis lyrata]